MHGFLFASASRFFCWLDSLDHEEGRPVRSALILTRGSRIAEQKSRAKGLVTAAGYTDTRTRGLYMQVAA